MAQTKSVVLLVLIIVLGNFFVGALTLKTNNIILDDISPLENFKNNLEFKIEEYSNNQKETGFINSISNLGNVALLLPVTLLDGLLDLLIIMAIGFKTIPNILHIIFIAPLSFIVILEYIIPVIRGN